MDVIAGTPFSVKVDVGPFPVDDSVVYTIYDNNLAPVAGYDQVIISTTSTTTTVKLDVPSSLTTISGPFEKLWIVFTWLNAAGNHSKKFSILLTPMLPTTADAQSVRSRLGVNTTELPDSDIGIFSAYLDVKQVVTDIDTRLSSATYDEVVANKLILLRTCLNVVSSLKLRIAQAQENGQSRFERYDIDTFDELKHDLQCEYQSLLFDVLDLEDDLDGVLFEVVDRPDPFTDS